MPASGHGIAASASCRGGLAPKVGRQRLDERAVGHPGRFEHQFSKHIRERPFREVLDRELHNRVAAACIPPARADGDVDAHRSGICGRRAVEQLQQRRDRFPAGVAAEPRDRHAAGVRQQVCERDFLPGGELVVRQLPRRQVGVDVLVERQLPARHERECRDRGDRLADRRSLEPCLRVDAPPRPDVGHPPAARPVDAAVLEHGDAHAGNVQLPHALFECARANRLSLDQDRRQEAMLDAANAFVGWILRPERGGHRQQRQAGDRRADSFQRLISSAPESHFLCPMIFWATAMSSSARRRSDSARATARPKLVRR